MRSGKRRGSPIKVVLDTNVLVSAFLWNGNESVVFGLCRKGAMESLISQAILNELDDVLQRKFGVRQDRRFGIVRAITSVSRLITITGDLRVLDDDPSDDAILETALQGGAEFVVTGDGHLLSLGAFQGIRILRAAEVVRLIASR
jgi:putative PIN family toxin of toxin-antitoxin system